MVSPFRSVHNGVGSRTSAARGRKFDQTRITEASAMTLRDVKDGSLSPDTAKVIPYALQSSKRKGADTEEAIFIPGSTMNVIMDRAQRAFVCTRSLAESEDALICDGGVTSTLTRSLENRMLVKEKVVDIQTAHGVSLMSTSHRCLKTYHIRDRVGEIHILLCKHMLSQD
jgi:hypothetical protein